MEPMEPINNYPTLFLLLYALPAAIFRMIVLWSCHLAPGLGFCQVYITSVAPYVYVEPNLISARKTFCGGAGYTLLFVDGLQSVTGEKIKKLNWFDAFRIGLVITRKLDSVALCKK